MTNIYRRAALCLVAWSASYAWGGAIPAPSREVSRGEHLAVLATDVALVAG